MLSLVVPFYNSAHKSLRLLEQLSLICDQRVELVFVDDGSIDNTFELLCSFKEKTILKRVIVFKQENKGPGGARNTGLMLATGKYVWYVDSDDSIDLSIFEYIFKILECGYDFVGFDYFLNGDVVKGMHVTPGEHSIEVDGRIDVLEYMGPHWVKVNKRSWLIGNNIFYPELITYEDNYLEYIVPFYIDSYFYLNKPFYIYNQEYDSITRNRKGDNKLCNKFFDRVVTSNAALKKGLLLCSCSEEKEILKTKYQRIMLFNTSSSLVLNAYSCLKSLDVVGLYRDITYLLRIMKLYREADEVYKMPDFNTLLNSYGKKFRYVFKVVFPFSKLIPGKQEIFFKNKHCKAWNKKGLEI